MRNPYRVTCGSIVGIVLTGSRRSIVPNRASGARTPMGWICSNRSSEVGTSVRAGIALTTLGTATTGNARTGISPITGT